MCLEARLGGAHGHAPLDEIGGLRVPSGDCTAGCCPLSGTIEVSRQQHREQLVEGPLGALLYTIEGQHDIERIDPFYQRFDLDLFERALSEVWAEPARRVPYFGPIELA